MAVLTSVLLTALGGYLLLMAGVYFGQAHLLYLPNLPSREIALTPKDVGLPYDDVWLRTEDGVRLHGWYLPAESGRATMIFFHGNAGNISHRLDSLRIFHSLRLSVLIIDYRGYGKSEGSPSEKGTQHDALAAWRYITEAQGVPAQKVVLFGRSLGAAIASDLAVRHQPGALIVESAFTSVPDMGAELYWWLPVRQLSRFRYATREDVARVRCPVLVVHSPEDEIIPFRHAEAIFAGAREPKELLRLIGSHNEGFMLSGNAYGEGLDRFLERHLGLPGTRP